jgi:hypothetical protein
MPPVYGRKLETSSLPPLDCAGHACAFVKAAMPPVYGQKLGFRPSATVDVNAEVRHESHAQPSIKNSGSNAADGENLDLSHRMCAYRKNRPSVHSSPRHRRHGRLRESAGMA